MRTSARDLVDAIAKSGRYANRFRSRLNRCLTHKSRGLRRFNDLKNGSRQRRPIASRLSWRCIVTERCLLSPAPVAAHCRRCAAIFRGYGHSHQAMASSSQRYIPEQRCLPISGSGGEEGIRTLDTTFAVWRFSKALPSATRPPLRCRSYDSNLPGGSNRKACAD
jgi:hypothetical protein